MAGAKVPAVSDFPGGVGVVVGIQVNAGARAGATNFLQAK